MKIIAVFLSMIVMALSILPCCPLAEENAINIQQENGVGTYENGHETDDCSHDCSPFYTCGNCVGFAVEYFGLLTRKLHPTAILHNSIYQQSDLPSIDKPIWQPPKILS